MKKFLWYFVAFHLVIGVIGGGIAIIQATDVKTVLFSIIMIGVFGVLACICFKKAKVVNKKIEKVQGVNTIKDICIEGKHVVGLPIAEGIECVINYKADNIEIIQGNNTFNLNISKVTDITDTTDVEIQKQYVSSTGGTVGGYMLFGPLGAMVGGRAKKKTSKKVTNYLVITYTDSEEIKYISFEYAPVFSLKIIRFIDRFNETERQQVSVNL